MVRVTFRHCTPFVLLQRSSMKYPWMDTLCITNFLIRIRASPLYEAFSTLIGPAHRSIHFSTLEYTRLLVYYTLSVPFYRPRRNIRELCEHPASYSSEFHTWWSGNQSLIYILLGSFWSLLSELPSDSTILLLKVSGIQTVSGTHLMI